MKNILSIAALAAIVGAGAVEGAVASTNLVQDPSFETTTYQAGVYLNGFYYGVGNNQYWYNLGPYYGGTLRGVAQNQDNLFNYTENWSAQPSGNFMYMDGGSNYQTYAFGQLISGLTPNQEYTVTFQAAYAPESEGAGDTIEWYGNLGGAAEFNGSGGTFSGFSGGSTGNGPDVSIPAAGTGWNTVSFNVFAGSSTTEQLSFIALGTGAPPFALITDISLTTAADPGALPSTPEPSTWAMMGLGFLGLAGLGIHARRNRATTA